MTDAIRHEASHCAMALYLGRDVEDVWVTTGLSHVGEQVGGCHIPVGDEIEHTQPLVCLAGYLSESEPGYPPPWPDCLADSRESLGLVLLKLRATEEAYAKSVQLTRIILEDEDFIHLRDRIARALSQVPHLDREAIQSLAKIATPLRP
jgi:hypothetical protein